MCLYLCFAALYDKKRIFLNLMDSTGDVVAIEW